MYIGQGIGVVRRTTFLANSALTVLMAFQGSLLSIFIGVSLQYPHSQKLRMGGGSRAESSYLLTTWFF